MKKNGFACPLHWQQIITWIILTLNIVSFYIFTINLLYKDDKYILMVTFGFLTIIVVIVGCIATNIDPSDKIFKAELAKRKKQEKEQGNYILEISKKYDFCVICCSNIDSSSKHCKNCNRCVDNFDHHCNWLNNCIGKQNYSTFFTLLVSVFINLFYNVAVMTYAFILYIYSSDKNKEIMSSQCKQIGVSSGMCAGISLGVAILDFVIFLNITYLIIIHTWLRCQGLTTYEYIVKYLNNNEIKNKKNVNDNSENIDLKFNNILEQKFEINNRAQNKILPEDLLIKIKNIGNENIKFVNNSDKIIINDKNYKSKIFKPIIDDIYCSNMNTKKYDESQLTSHFKQNNLNYVNTPREIVKGKKIKILSRTGNNYLNNISGTNLPSIDIMHTGFDCQN